MIQQTLERWLKQGYTDNETPLDDYGREVLRDVLDFRCPNPIRGAARHERVLLDDRGVVASFTCQPAAPADEKDTHAMTTKPRRNPQDSTRRNVTASAKRDAAWLERIRKARAVLGRPGKPPHVRPGVAFTLTVTP